ncbi:hypothetical protein IWX90DRAFT_495682 [Phyllosticta citrichinensis]|uniref:Uncharacterized protein n=1 Tax=Phyllosticta citrichinensis TaxID=1130410 RepID=A0ABR1XG30_9PEZI
MAEPQTLDPPSPPYPSLLPPPPQLKDLAALVTAQAAHASAIDAILLSFIRDRGISDSAAAHIPLLSKRLNVNRCRLLAALLAPPFSPTTTADPVAAEMSVADVLCTLGLMDRGFATQLARLLALRSEGDADDDEDESDEQRRRRQHATWYTLQLDAIAAAIQATMTRESIRGDWRIDELRAAMQVDIEAYWEQDEWRAERRRRDHPVGAYRVDKFLKTFVHDDDEPAVVEAWVRRGGHVRDRPGYYGNP